MRLRADHPEKASRIQLYAGDNRQILGALDEKPQLAYLDPPFFTQRSHQRIKRSTSEQGILREAVHAFDDHWEDLDAFLASVEESAKAAWDSLSDDGTLILHVDSKTSHYLKVALDKICGRANFASEIIWRYRRWPAKTANFQRVHDVLLRYVKDPKQPRFQQLYEDLAPSTKKTWGSGKQQAQVDANGRRKRSQTTDVKSPGVPLGDVWEIGIIAPVAKERTGYPTQKPLALMTRLIESCSLPGDTILDPFCGSGSTLVAAASLGRHAIGIDLGEEALKVTQERFSAIGYSWQDVPTESKPGVKKVVNHASSAELGRIAEHPLQSALAAG